MITISVLGIMLFSLVVFSGSKAVRTAKPAALNHRIADANNQGLSG